MILTTIQDNLYLCWQAELLQYNVQQLGAELIILIGYQGRPSPEAAQLAETCGAILIEDTRSDHGYAPSIQPHLLAKFRHPRTEPVLILDSDVMLTALPHLDTTDICGSDVTSYISAAYLDGCDPELLHHLCTIAHLPPDYVRQHRHCIGAHYWMPHLFDAQFWRTVEDNSNRMYHLLRKYRCAIHPVQTWTASMWAILYELYRMERINACTVRSAPELDFAWATEPISRMASVNILHMAGVTDEMEKRGFFYKGRYTSTKPWHCDLTHVSPDNCSYLYAQAITSYTRHIPRQN